MKTFTADPTEVAAVLLTPAGRHLPYQQVHNNITLLNLSAEVQAIADAGKAVSLSNISNRVDRLCDLLAYLLANDCIDVSSTFKK